MKKGSEKMETIMESSLWLRLVSYLETGKWYTGPILSPFERFKLSLDLKPTK